MTHDSHVTDWQIWQELVRLSGTRPDHRVPHFRVDLPEETDPAVSRSQAPSPGISSCSRMARGFARS